MSYVRVTARQTCRKRTVELPGKAYTCWICRKVRVRQGSRLEEEETVFVGGGDHGRDVYLPTRKQHPWELEAW